jgi:hypothetical protein
LRLIFVIMQVIRHISEVKLQKTLLDEKNCFQILPKDTCITSIKIELTKGCIGYLRGRDLKKFVKHDHLLVVVNQVDLLPYDTESSVDVTFQYIHRSHKIENITSMDMYNKINEFLVPVIEKI